MTESRKVETTRFGEFTVAPEQIWTFPAGLIGLPTSRKWLLLGEDGNSAVAWLQSTENAAIALPLISPRRFVKHYKARLRRTDLAPLQLADDDLLFVLTTLAVNGSVLTTDLRAPLLFNSSKRLGHQAVTLDDQPLQFVLPVGTERLKRSA